jgi:hypothetical protein
VTEADGCLQALGASVPFARDRAVGKGSWSSISFHKITKACYNNAVVSPRSNFVSRGCREWCGDVEPSNATGRSIVALSVRPL